MASPALPAESEASGKRVAVAAAGLAGLLVLGLVLRPGADLPRLAQLVVNGVITGSILALAGVGATLILASSGWRTSRTATS